MTSPAFSALLDVARVTHAETPALKEFCDFPDDLEPCAVSKYHVNAYHLMRAEAGWPDGTTHPLAQAFLDAAPEGHWRETYKDTDIGQDFMDRFGCYCLIGPDAPWTSRKMFGFMVYMPPGLWYPWHHHPAEETYLVIAGEGEFLREGTEPETLRAGDAMFHSSNESHALRTHDSPIMAYVVWRNHFDIKPVLSEGMA